MDLLTSYIYILLLVGLTPWVQANLGDPCTNQADCTGDNQVCSPQTNGQSVCACGVGYQADGTDCKIDNGDTCTQSPKDQCKSPLSCQTTDYKCGCGSDQYYDGSQCHIKKGHSVKCDLNAEVSESECRDSNAQCASSAQSPTSTEKYCLCQADYFYNNISLSCKPVRDLQVLFAHVSITTTSVSFTWTPLSDVGASVLYRIRTSNNLYSVTASSGGGSVSGLVPGTSYSFILESYISPTGLYGEKKTSVNVGLVWTKPAMSSGYDATSSQLMTNPMTFGFNAASGQVRGYKVDISTLPPPQTLQYSQTVTSTRVTGLNLSLGETYSYKIISVNGNSEESEASTGNFRTNSAAAGLVSELSLQQPTTSGVDVTWKPPSAPNDEVYAYVVKVKVQQDSSCLSAYVLACSDCTAGSAAESLTFDDCTHRVTGTTFPSSASSLSQSVSSLTSYTLYDIQVYAVNEAGNGFSTTNSLRTLETAPENLQALEVSGYRDPVTEKVGLDIQWTPGRQTGLTAYTVTVTDKGDPASVFTQTLNGYSTTRTRKGDLLAYHEYTVSVYAVTSLEQSPPLAQDKRTETTNPGKVQNLKVTPDAIYADRMSLEFECPQEAERNGVIQGFVIIQEKQGTNQEEMITIDDSDCSQVIVVGSDRLQEIQVYSNYTFKVIAKNQDFEGQPSSPVGFYAAPKSPVLGSTVLTQNSSVETSETSVKVNLCPSCLTDKQQGNVDLVGLIVCVKSSSSSSCNSGRRKRAALDRTAYASFQNWATAKGSGFSAPYRVTPDDWVQTLGQSNAASVEYEVGQEQCSTSVASTVYCNGPLPSGKDIVVTVFACTEAGCTVSSDVVVSTKALKGLKRVVPGPDSDDDSDSSTGVIVAVIVAVIVVIIVVGVGIICLLRKRRNKDSPPHALDTEELKHRHVPEAVSTPEPRVPLEELSGQDTRELIKIGEFSRKVQNLHRDSNLKFHAHFEAIQSRSAHFLFTCEEAKKENNRVKNRLVTILPYDHSRVQVAMTLDAEEGSDFINASYIPGLTSQREYIASQGPMHATIPHFWRMVWEQKSKVIVMLSDLMENNKLKVDRYWPDDLNTPVNYGGVEVEVTRVSRRGKCVISLFKLSLGKACRWVTHFLLSGLWDFNANLTFDDVVDFARLVRREIKPGDCGPPIFHCSAGVGRTGSFIALDYFLHYTDRHSLGAPIDVDTYVLEMRKNRPHMVQTEAQYIFLFDALVEVINRKMKAEREHVYEGFLQEDENIYTYPTDEEDSYNRFLPMARESQAQNEPWNSSPSYSNLGIDML